MWRTQIDSIVIFGDWITREGDYPRWLPNCGFQLVIRTRKISVSCYSLVPHGKGFSQEMFREVTETSYEKVVWQSEEERCFSGSPWARYVWRVDDLMGCPIHVYIYLYIYIYMYLWICTYIYIVLMYTYIYIYILYVCIHIYIYLYTLYLCKHIYIYT